MPPFVAQAMESTGVNKVLKMNKALAAVLLATIFMFISIGTAMADHNETATATPTIVPSATPTPTPTPAPNATATPVPTPAPRQVFSSPKWDTDHVTITVNNGGDPITVTAWIDNTSKKATISVGAGETMVISTPSINAQNGQIVKFGFEAAQNNTVIDSYSATITVNLGPTPTALPPESVTIAGTVLDADNSSPIAGATVTFRSLTYGKTYPAVDTGADGTFTSPKMYPDEYAIKVTAPGYQAMALTSEKVSRDSIVDNILLKRQATASTPTPIPPTPTPVNPVDSWISLLYNPALCVGTISSMIAVIAGSIGIYEWMERKRENRLKKGEAPKGIEKKDEAGPKKP